MKNFLLNCKAIFSLILIHIKNLFSDIKKLLLLILVIVLLGVIFKTMVYDKNKPVIGIVTDDNSLEMNLLLNNLKKSDKKDVFSIEKRSPDNIKDCIFVAKLENDAINKLDTNPPIDVELYYNTEDISVKFIKSYIDDIANFVNSTQKSAMLYWDKLKSTDESFDERFEKVNNLGLFVLTSFVSRGDYDVQNADAISSVEIFLITLIFIVALFINNDILVDFKNGVYQRLILNGFKPLMYILSRIILSIILSSIILLISINLYNLYISKFDIEFYRIIIMLLFCNILSIVSYFSFGKIKGDI